MKVSKLGNVISDEGFKNQTITDAKTVIDWLSFGFEQYANTTAIRFRKERLSYNELDKLSNKIANYLGTNGIGRGDRVGICLQRSSELIASVIGILKSGAAYVPLDPTYPVERLNMMQDDACLSLLILHQEFSDKFESRFARRVYWEEIETQMHEHTSIFSPVEINEKDVAYVIFTSGSTGRPKGIEMPHRALANLIEWQLQRPYFKTQSRVLQYSSISFDVSFQEIATTLASGGTLCLVSDNERRDPRVLLPFLNEQGIERLFIPFVALRSLVEVAIGTNTFPAFLSEIITAGEQLRVDDGLRNFFTKMPNTVLENQYGPSETHVISAYILDGHPSYWPDLPPIGKPVKNCEIHVLDTEMKPVQRGENGELYLSGRNLALGYINRPDITSKVFIETDLPGNGKQLLYKTGDLGFVNENGDIEFSGRADHQIKIHGYRIEPGEIDTVGSRFPGISQCITHPIKDANGRRQLVTYYLLQEDALVDEKSFKVFLSEKLPAYMVPKFVQQLTNIPFTPSGKVDVNSLPKPNINTANKSEKIVYKTESEAQLAKIWSRLLGIATIKREDDFFVLGGDSLNAVTLFMQIEQHFGKDLPLSTLGRESTLAGLAEKISQEESTDRNKFRSLQVIQKGSKDEIPLFLVHGGAGNVLMFFDLAQSLPIEQPIWGFQWPGWDGFKGIDDIMEMARFYKQELRQAYPEGPYRLGGYCIGGIIALEIAELLKAEGAKVIDPILVVDAPNIYSNYFHLGYPEFSQESRQTFESLKLELAARLPHKGDEHLLQNESIENTAVNPAKRRYPLLAKYLPFYLKLGKQYLVIERFLNEKLQKLRIWFRVKLSLKLSVGDRRRYCQITQIDAVKSHKKRIYNGDILYLKSEALHGGKLSIEGWWDDLFFGFGELCSGRFDAHVVGEKHNNVLQSPLAHQIIKEKMLGINE